MPSTRKPNARETRSRQSDVMSDSENVDIMLGSFSRKEVRNEQNKSDVDVDLESSRLQRITVIVSEDFRSPLNTNSKENNEMTIETTRTINDEITNQVTRTREEIRSDLNSQILEAINSAITEKVLPTIQDTLSRQERGNTTIVDCRSGGLYGSPQARNSQEILENCFSPIYPEPGKIPEPNRVSFFYVENCTFSTSCFQHFQKLNVSV